MSHLTRYSLLSDAALCALAQAGDNRAVETVLARHDGWIRKGARKWRIPGHDAEDVYSVAMTGAMNAVLQFDAARKVKLITFLWYGIRTECDHAFVTVNRISRGRGTSTLSLDVMIEDGWDPTHCTDSGRRQRGLEEIALGELEGQRLRRVLMASQRGCQRVRNRRVLQMLIDGAELGEVSAAEGISSQRVNRIRERARVPLARAMDVRW